MLTIGTTNAWANDPYVPDEILSAYSYAPYPFTYAEIYSVTFKTDPDALAGILPEGFIPVTGYEDYVMLLFNSFASPDANIRPYWELILTVPAQHVKSDLYGSYTSQLYLGSIESESNMSPTLSGQLIYGFPKREAIFHVMGNFGGKHVKVDVERHGNTIVRADFKKRDVAPDLAELDLPPSGPSFLLKAVPKVTGDGWDVLQITVGGGSGGDCLDYQPFESKAVDVRFKGPIVLDTGREIPVIEIIYADFSSSQWCLGCGKTFHDYLAPTE